MFDIKPVYICFSFSFLFPLLIFFHIVYTLPGPSSTDKGLPDLKTGSPTVKPPIKKKNVYILKHTFPLIFHIPVSS